jgi:hypothetical protein
MTDKRQPEDPDAKAPQVHTDHVLGHQDPPEPHDGQLDPRHDKPDIAEETRRNKAMAEFLAPFGATVEQRGAVAAYDGNTTCWLSIGGLQIGPVGLDALRQQVAGVEPQDHHHDQKKRA